MIIFLWLCYFLLCKALWITIVYDMCYINKLALPNEGARSGLRGQNKGARSRFYGCDRAAASMIKTTSTSGGPDHMTWDHWTDVGSTETTRLGITDTIRLWSAETSRFVTTRLDHWIWKHWDHCTCDHMHRLWHWLSLTVHGHYISLIRCILSLVYIYTHISISICKSISLS